MSSQLAGADLQAEMERVARVQQLAGRVGNCIGRTEEILAGFGDIQLLQWQSPAGREYRNSVSLQAAALSRALDTLREAQAAVERHSRETFTAACTYPGTP